MNPETALEAATAGAKAATKLGEIFEKEMGARWRKKQADADAYADEKKLEIIRNNPDMDIVYAGEKMYARKRAEDALAYRAEQRQLAESKRQQRSIENVFEIAANEVASLDDNTVSDAPVDDDWIARFFQIVKDINSEEMQFVWGKILAGEIEQPGSFSLRTLDVIRNINKQEAEEFQKIVPLVMQEADSKFITSSSDVYSQFGIELGSILRLNECGLINADGTLLMDFPVTNHQGVSIFNKETLIRIFGTDSEETHISFGIYALTRAGAELHRILNYTVNNAYCFSLAEEICKKHKKARASVCKVYNIKENAISYEDVPLKTFGAENGGLP